MKRTLKRTLALLLALLLAVPTVVLAEEPAEQAVTLGVEALEAVSAGDDMVINPDIDPAVGEAGGGGGGDPAVRSFGRIR